MKLMELTSKAEVIDLDKRLDKMFMSLGLNVEFSRHFVDRLLGREKRITEEELLSSFLKLKKKWKKKLLKAKKEGNFKAVLKDFDNDVNVVFAIKNDELNNITVMKKDPTVFGSRDKHKQSQTEFPVGKK